MYRLWIFILQLQMIFVTVAFSAAPYTATVVNTSVAQNVTPCFSGIAYNIKIFNDSFTWTEADYLCKQMKYKGVIAINSGWKQWFHVRDVLKNAGFPENKTFWEGHFRPFFHVTEWYEVKGEICKQYNASIISGQVKQFHQCAVVEWETYSQSQRLRAENCSENLPYICYKSDGPANFLFYDGFVMAQHNITEIEYEFNETIDTLDECAQTCMDHVSCISFSFDHTSSNCIMINIIYGFGPVTFEIVPGFVNKTFGVKTGCSVSISNTSADIPLTGVDLTLRSCGLSPIPAHYCEMALSTVRNVTLNETELEHVVSELINNLTVTADSTSSNQRKYQSVSDLRPSATFLGTIAAIMLATVVSLPILSDILTYYWQSKNLKKKRQGKSRKRKDFKTSITS